MNYLERMAGYLSRLFDIMDSHIKKYPDMEHRIGRLLFAVFLFFVAWLIWGCCDKETRVIREPYTVYQDVYIPTPCNVEKPTRPEYQGEVVADTLNILKYTEELEISLNACIGGK